MNAIVQNNIFAINSLCKKYKVDRLFTFGSVLSDRFSGRSEVDLLVKFRSVDLFQYADNYFDFKFSLENVLKRHVDLLEEQAIKNPYLLKSINASKQIVYERAVKDK